MNDIQQRPAAKADAPLRETPPRPGRRTGRRLLGAGTFLLLCAASSPCCTSPTRH